MKLTSEQIDSVTRQFEAQHVPQDNRMIEELYNIFGEHTFFLDNNGLHTVEKLAEPEEAGAPIVRVVKLASWTRSGSQDIGGTSAGTDRSRDQS